MTRLFWGAEAGARGPRESMPANERALLFPCYIVIPLIPPFPIYLFNGTEIKVYFFFRVLTWQFIHLSTVLPPATGSVREKRFMSGFV